MGTSMVINKVKTETIGMSGFNVDYEKRLKDVVNFVGKENIKLFLTFSEQDGYYKDLFNKDIIFSSQVSKTRFPSKIGGPLGYYISNFDGINDIILQDGITNSATGNLDPTHSLKYATRLDVKEGMVSMVGLMLRAKGIITNSKFKVSLYDDNNGAPGVQIGLYNKLTINGRQDLQLKSLSSSYTDIRIPLIDDFPIKANSYCWLVLEYDDTTGIDANNHVQWRYGTETGAKRATFNGTTWTTIDNETFEYKLFNEKLFLEEDFTIALPLYEQIPNNGLIDIFEITNGAERIFRLGKNYGNLYAEYTDENNNKLNLQRPANFKKWSVIIITFSKYNQLEKLGMYQNGKLIDDTAGDTDTLRRNRDFGVGYGNTALKRGANYSLGRSYNADGTISGTSLNGAIGPLLVINKCLNKNEVSELSNLIMNGVN